MPEQSENKGETTITSEVPSERPATGELTDQELDEVSGGDGKAPASTTSTSTPTESLTLNYTTIKW